MATLSIVQSPNNALVMMSAAARVPLRDAPSAVLNSPMGRASQQQQQQLQQVAAGIKRSRGDLEATSQQQLANTSRETSVSASTQSSNQNANIHLTRGKTTVNVQVNAREESLSGLHKRSAAGPTTLQKKLEAARGLSISKQQNALSVVQATEIKKNSSHEQTMENVRVWQKHYRKAFPQMVFYFDGLPKDLMHKLAGQVRTLGASEVMFFSRDVTHVITTRPIPTDMISTSSSHAQKSPRQDNLGTGKTINPQLLDSRTSKFTFESNVNKKFSSSSDILHKAKEWGMKIWSVEKIQRILNALNDHDAERFDAKPVTSRAKTGRGAELSQLLQNERRQATTDRDWMSEMVAFKGYYVYVHDMDERTKPVMIRDYQKPSTNSQGKWPQLRSNSLGKSPYIEEAISRRQTAPVTKTAEQMKLRTRASTTTVGTTATKKNVLTENPNPPVVTHAPEQPATHPAPPKRGGSTDQLPMFGSAQASIRKIPRFVQGEPVASGVQHSNVTSAVRSTMVSSTAAVPGGKSGSTRELNALKRKVLENQAAARQGNVNTANLANGNARLSKRKMLNDIVEEDESLKRRAEQAPRKKRVVEKEPKPGYCENCHDKFDDFDDHIVSKTHRKFATDSNNFRELDNLLSRLERI